MNPDLDGLARLAWAQLWQVTVVALVIGAVVRLCCRDRPRLAYALWMLVVVKSIAPPVWSSPTGLFSWALVGDAAARLDVAEKPPGILMNSPETTPAGRGPARTANGIEGGTARGRGMDWARFRPAVFSIWFTGLVLCTAFVLGKQIACSELIRKSSLPVDERNLSALADLSHRLGVRRGARLIVTSRQIGPAVFGLLRPSILLPASLLSDTSPEQIELIIAHELIHVRRGDIWASKLQLVAQLLWWFNPLVLWANRQAICERERCCDAEVVSGVGCKPGLYARTLLSVLEHKGRLRSLGAIPGVRALEVTSLRLESIMRYTDTNHQRASYLARLAFAAGAVVLVPGMGLALRSSSPTTDRPLVANAGQVASVAEAPGAGVVDDGGAKSQGSSKKVRPEPALERLGDWVGMEILTRPETRVIPRALRLTEDQVARVTKLVELRKQRLSQGFQGTLHIDLLGPRETFPAQITAFVNREAGKALVEILTPAQCKRSEQIILTSHGVRAFRYSDVRKDLRVTPEQEQKIDAIIDGLFARLRALQNGPGGQPKDYDGAMALEGAVEPLWKGALERVLALLTPEQSKQWKAMVGEPFRADEAESKPTPRDR